jgi:chromosome partitioning protein
MKILIVDDEKVALTSLRRILRRRGVRNVEICDNGGDAIRKIKEGDFDIVLLDPPPALGMLSLSVLRAADALLIPAPPNNIDFGSTAHFLKMMAATLEQIAQYGGARDYAFVKILATKLNDNKSAHAAIRRMMEAVFPEEMMNSVLKDSAEIDNATANLGTVYEVSGAATRNQTHRRCRAYLDAVGREVETLVRKTWPSHRNALELEGLL